MAATPATARYPETKVLSRLFDVKDGHTLAVARKHGAYRSLEKALKSMTPAQVTDEVKIGRASCRERV